MYAYLIKKKNQVIICLISKRWNNEKNFVEQNFNNIIPRNIFVLNNNNKMSRKRMYDET